MKKLVEKIQKILGPVSAKLQKLKFLMAISETMQLLLPVIIIGSFGCLLAFLGIPAWQNFLTANPVLKTIFMNMQSWTMSILSVYIVIALPYLYAVKLGLDTPISASILTFASFMLLTMPTPYAAIETTWLGHAGMFSAFIIAWLVTRLIKLMIDKKITIKLPESVPEIISSAFATLIPGAVVIVLSAAIGQGFAATKYGTIHQLLYTVIQTPLQKIGLSYGGLLAFDMVATISMFCGIHGTSTTAWFSPLLQSASAANLEAYAAGTAMPYIVDKGMSDLTKIGGIGSTLAVVLLILLIARSKRLRQVSRVAIVPQLFNINEPVLFGLPIMLNPLCFIPYVLGQFVSTTGIYVAVATGFIGHSNGTQVSWTIPPFISTALTNTTPVRAVLFQLFLLVLIMLIWYPFVKMMDRQYVAEENGELGEAQNA